MKKITFSVFRLLLLFVLPVFLPLKSSYGQLISSDPIFRHFSVRDGLPGSEVHKVLQDRKGYLWFATDMGVARYNGYEFKIFGVKDGLTENSILDLYEDYKGRIWFISFSCKLSFLENDTIHEYKFNNLFLNGMNGAIHNDFYVDKNDNVFIGVLYYGYFKISADGEIQKYNSISPDTVKIDIFSIDNSYVFTNLQVIPRARNGLMRIKSNLNNFKNDTLLIKLNIEPNFKTIAFKENAVSFIGSSLLNIYPDEIKRYDFNQTILTLAHDSDELFWVGFIKGGAQLIDLKQGFIHQHLRVLDGLSVTSSAIDFEGGYWFTTLEDGVYYLPTLKFKSLNLLDNLEKKKITSLAANDNYIYATCNSNTIYKISRQTESNIEAISLFPSVSGYFSKSYYDFVQNKLLLSGPTTREFTSLDSEDKESFISKTSMSSDLIRQLNAEGLIGGTLNGLVLYKDNCITPINRNKMNLRVTAVDQLENGTVLVGTINGLYKLNPDSVIVPYDSTSKILSTRITDIKRITRDFFVLATKGNGILIFSPDTTYVINSSDKLISDNINSINVHDYDIWLSTNSGLSQVKIHKLDPLSYDIRNFSLYDGLPTPEINASLFCDNRVYLGTNQGIYYFNPGHFEKFAVQPRIYLSRISINNKKVRITDNLNLKSYENNISISVDGISYSSSGKINYRYRLSGRDTAWLYTENRQINFNGLTAGTYLLQVNAISATGNVSVDQVNLQFKIKEKLINTLLFKVIVLVFIGVIVFLFLRHRIAAINKRAKEKSKILQTISELELKALRAQMNPHFTFNVLNSIGYFVTYNDSISAQKYLTRFAKLVRLILDFSRNESNSLAEEMKMLGLYLELENLRFDEKFSFSIEVKSSIDPLQCMVPSMFIQPFVENAIKHGLEKKKGAGIVNINFEMENNILICTVIDNGIGRKKAQEIKMNSEGSAHSSLASEIAQARMDAFNRTHKHPLKISIFDLEDPHGINQGTEVKIYIPQINEQID